METHQVTEVPLYHELESFSRTCHVPSNHRIPCHNLADRRVMRVKPIRGHL